MRTRPTSNVITMSSLLSITSIYVHLLNFSAISEKWEATLHSALHSNLTLQTHKGFIAFSLYIAKSVCSYQTALLFLQYLQLHGNK